MAYGDCNNDLKNQLEKLKETIKEKDEVISNLKRRLHASLSNEEINRYSRQILLPNIGIEGQLDLKHSSVLIVGTGGLGCPAALYLAGSGIGHIGLVDYDEVEVNNLHRQILHTKNKIGQLKVDSAAESLKNINDNLKVSCFPVLLDSSNAMKILSDFDIVVDATDNVATRYLLNDACVLLRKPLVSGSALQMEGQLTVYNHNGGPCYRCVFPTPPPPESVTNCSEGGVLGVIPGVIGVLQALETIKIILKQNVLAGFLLLFDGSDSTFRRVKLRNSNPNCAVCGKNPEIKELIDYEQFCGSRNNDKNPNLQLLPDSKRVTVEEFNQLKNECHVLIDVRSECEYKICKLMNSINIPIRKIDSSQSVDKIQAEIDSCEKKGTKDKIPVFVVCRRGNDSQIAVLALEKLFQCNKDVEIKDIKGGLHAWANIVDSNFPIY